MELVKDIVIATHNPDKKKEILIALRELGVNILSVSYTHLTLPTSDLV